MTAPDQAGVWSMATGYVALDQMLGNSSYERLCS